MNKLAIIDSGIGGLTIVNYLNELNEDICITYVRDNEYFPYGTKTNDELIYIIDRIINNLVKQNFNYIIIACNTASYIYSKYLSGKYSCHVFPIITATVLDLNKNSKRVGVIGTNKTIESNIYEETIQAVSKTEVFSLACQELVELCELQDIPKIKRYVEEKFGVFKNEKIDTLILGCTHFNSIYDILNDYFDYKVNIINSGYSLVRKFINLDLMKCNVNKIYNTKIDNDFNIVASKFLETSKKYEIINLNF